MSAPKLRPVTDAEAAIEILKRNQMSAVIPNPDPFASLDKGNAFISIMPDMKEVEEKIMEDFAEPITLLDMPLRLFPRFLSDSFLGILNDLLNGNTKDVLFKEDRFIAIALLFLLIVILSAFF